jgi:hypothetical protein
LADDSYETATLAVINTSLFSAAFSQGASNDVKQIAGSTTSSSIDTDLLAGSGGSAVWVNTATHSNTYSTSSLGINAAGSAAGYIRYRGVGFSSAGSAGFWSSNGSWYSSSYQLPAVGSIVTTPGHIRGMMTVPMADTTHAATITVTYNQTSTSISGTTYAGTLACLDANGLVLAYKDLQASDTGATFTCSLSASHGFSNVKIFYARGNAITSQTVVGSGGVAITEIDRLQ